MATTISDYGRTSEKYGEISFYYAFPYRFWFGQHQIAPEDVLTWCRENATGYYKVVAYAHESSVRDEVTGAVVQKVVYVDKIYLEKGEDAMAIKLTFDVNDTKVQRPRLKRKYKARAKKVKDEVVADVEVVSDLLNSVVDETNQDTVALLGTMFGAAAE